MYIIKVCSICKTEKNYEDFPKNRSRKDGYHNVCKKCKSDSDKRSYEKNLEKRKANMKKYYENNKEKFLADCKVYREENKDKIAKCKKEWAARNRERKSKQEREWRENNIERIRETQNRWYLKNKDRVYSSLLKRRSKKHFVRFEGLRRIQILDKDNWTCRNCGVQVHDKSYGGNEKRHLWDDEFKAHIDHIIPISKGGDSTLENLQVLCRTCNLSKGNRTNLSLNKNGQITFEI